MARALMYVTATCPYCIAAEQLLAGKGVRVTRLARGLPVGGDLEYIDGVTLARVCAHVDQVQEQLCRRLLLRLGVTRTVSVAGGISLVAGTLVSVFAGFAAHLLTATLSLDAGARHSVALAVSVLANFVVAPAYPVALVASYRDLEAAGKVARPG